MAFGRRISCSSALVVSGVSGSEHVLRRPAALEAPGCFSSACLRATHRQALQVLHNTIATPRIEIPQHLMRIARTAGLARRGLAPKSCVRQGRRNRTGLTFVIVYQE